MPKPYSSKDFYDRQWEQRHFQNLLSEGQNILISAPRRVGKTELAFKLLDWADSMDWKTAYGDVQQARDEADFLGELAKMFEEAGVSAGMGDQIRNACAALRKLQPTAKYSTSEYSVELKLSPEFEDAFETAKQSINQLLAAAAGKGHTIMLCLDELPIFLTTLCQQKGGEARAAHILHWFRSIRCAPQLRHVRWLLCGSIGLDTFVEGRGLPGTINDLKPEKLGPFAPEIAIEFIKFRAALGLEAFAMHDDLAKEVVERVGWALPYYLKLMVDEMQAIPPHLRQTDFPTLADVDKAYGTLVSADKRVQFMHWVTRLELQFGKVAALNAHAILKACCQKPEGVAKSRLRLLLIKRQPENDPEILERELVMLLGTLQRDGYLHSEDGSRWAFRSFLLRDFWKEHAVY